MPRLSRKDIDLVIALLRRDSRSRSGTESEENRLLRRLELRVEKPFEALRNWKRRGHTEMVRSSKQSGSAGGGK